MKKSFGISILILASISLSSNSFAGDDSSGNTTQDREQQQLQWCFIYSNLLGFNISYINNPRFYQCIGDWLGTPYKYSGSSKKGIDCSGLVCKIYSDSYRKVLEGCASDIYKNSEQIRRSDLREGDLVFFKIKRSRISHVGIYIAENKFVHASSKNGVIISSLDDPYYSRYFYKAGRIKDE